VANGIASPLSNLHRSTARCHHKDTLRKAMGHGPFNSCLRGDDLTTHSVDVTRRHTDMTKPRGGKRDESHLALVPFEARQRATTPRHPGRVRIGADVTLDTLERIRFSSGPLCASNPQRSAARGCALESSACGAYRRSVCFRFKSQSAFSERLLPTGEPIRSLGGFKNHC